MKVRCITLGAFQVNAYLLEDPVIARWSTPVRGRN